MKLLIAILFVLPSLAQAGAFTQPSQVSGTEYLFRGAQPIGHADVIRDAGINTVLIYKNDVRGEVVKEIAELKEVGYGEPQIHHIPMKWKDINLVEACQHTIKALQILIKGERDGVKTYFHCTAGEDRTGMIAALARMLLNRNSTEQVFTEEMCANGYSDGNSNKPRTVTDAIEQGLTPLFFALAEKIESQDLTTENLLPQMCDQLEAKPILRKCN